MKISAHTQQENCHTAKLTIIDTVLIMNGRNLLITYYNVR